MAVHATPVRASKERAGGSSIIAAALTVPIAFHPAAIFERAVDRADALVKRALVATTPVIHVFKVAARLPVV
jgi:hypothetical protein